MKFHLCVFSRSVLWSGIFVFWSGLFVFGGLCEKKVVVQVLIVRGEMLEVE